MPAMGIGAPRTSGVVRPNSPLEGWTAGRMASGTWRRAQSDGSQERAELRPREVGIEDEPGLLAHLGLRALRPERFAERRRPSILPYDGAMYRLAGGAVPQDRRLALVGDAERGDLARLHTRAPARLPQHAERDPPDLLRIVLDPSRPGIVLLEL